MQRLIGIMLSPGFVANNSRLLKAHASDDTLRRAHRYREKMAKMRLKCQIAFAPMAEKFSATAAIIAGFKDAVDVQHLEEFYFDPKSETGRIIARMGDTIGISQLKDYLNDTEGLHVRAHAVKLWDAVQRRAKDELHEAEKVSDVLVVGPSILVAAMGFVASNGLRRSIVSRRFHDLDPAHTQCYEVVFNEEGSPLLATVKALH